MQFVITWFISLLWSLLSRKLCLKILDFLWAQFLSLFENKLRHVPTARHVAGSICKHHLRVLLSVDCGHGLHLRPAGCSNPGVQPGILCCPTFSMVFWVLHGPVPFGRVKVDLPQKLEPNMWITRALTAGPFKLRITETSLAHVWHPISWSPSNFFPSSLKVSRRFEQR